MLIWRIKPLWMSSFEWLYGVVCAWDAVVAVMKSIMIAQAKRVGRFRCMRKKRSAAYLFLSCLLCFMQSKSDCVLQQSPSRTPGPPSDSCGAYRDQIVCCDFHLTEFPQRLFRRVTEPLPRLCFSMPVQLCALRRVGRIEEPQNPCLAVFRGL